MTANHTPATSAAAVSIEISTRSVTVLGRSWVSLSGEDVCVAGRDAGAYGFGDGCVA